MPTVHSLIARSSAAAAPHLGTCQYQHILNTLEMMGVQIWAQHSKFYHHYHSLNSVNPTEFSAKDGRQKCPKDAVWEKILTKTQYIHKRHKSNLLIQKSCVCWQKELPHGAGALITWHSPQDLFQVTAGQPYHVRHLPTCDTSCLSEQVQLWRIECWWLVLQSEYEAVSKLQLIYTTHQNYMASPENAV